MWLPRVRFTIRRLMVAVAVTAVVATLTQISCRWWRYRASYLTNVEDERSWLKFVAEQIRFHHRSRMAPEEVTRRTEERRAYKLRNVAYHAALKRKYEHAMWHPWVLVPLDPDPPE
jgi:hypothetical protein